MEPARRLREQRASFRCAVSGPRHVELRIDEQRYPGFMLDQSAGGFAVLLDRSPQVGEQSTVTLHTDAGDFEVRIAFVSEAEESSESDASDGDSRTLYRVGLARICDIIPLESIASPGLGSLARMVVESVFRGSNPTMLTGLGLVLVLAAVPVLLLPLFGHILASPVERCEPAAVRTSRHTRAPDRQERREAERTTPGAWRPGASGKSDLGGRIAKPAQDLARTHYDEFRRLARGAPGAAAFELPEVARQLRLTPQQQQHISRVVERTETSLAELTAQAHRVDRAQRSAERQAVLDAARREAVARLDEAQQAQWRLWAEQ